MLKCVQQLSAIGSIYKQMLSHQDAKMTFRLFETETEA